MSETLHKQSHENDKPSHEKQKEILVAPAQKHEKEVASISNESMEDLRETAEHEATPSKTLKENQLNHKDKDKPLIAPNKQVKERARDQLLAQTRRSMPKRQQQFSKFIHKPAVEQISDAASATIARPSGLLVGGIFSLLSSIVLLIACYYYGYTYNFLVAIMFFAGGFAVGLVIETFVRLSLARKA